MKRKYLRCGDSCRTNCLLDLGVLRTDRTHHDARAVGSCISTTRSCRIRMDRHVRVAVELRRRGSTTMRASSAIAPCSSAISGLMSSSADLRQLAHHLRDAQQHLSSAVAFTGGMLAERAEQASRRGCRGSSPATRNALSGGSATARSRSTSTAVPPVPKVIAGPKTVSRDDADHQLAPVADARHALHRDAVEARLRRCRCSRLDHLVVSAERTPARSPMLRRTPPTSDLVGDVGRVDLQHHRKARLGGDQRLVRVCARIAATSGMRNAASTALDSIVGQHRATFGECAVDHERAPSASGARAARAVRASEQQLLVAVELRETWRTLRPQSRAAKGGNPLVASSHRPPPPAPRPSSRRATVSRPLRVLDHRARRRQRRGHRLR